MKKYLKKSSQTSFLSHFIKIFILIIKYYLKQQFLVQNGLDFHQDNGGKLRNATTVLIYLDPVLNENDGPIRMLDKTHILGATHYPHYCRISSNKKYIYYSDFKGNHILTKQVPILGPVGTSIFFNGYTLHGSFINDDSKRTRLALRYVFSPNKLNKNSLFANSNKKIFTKSFFYFTPQNTQHLRNSCTCITSSTTT